ncbi:MAG: Holliday junction branch migration protein RuvA [Calditrichales bacterium]|nr:MAG: Holliday junction branch migration protein RuvA [Calditrichales bacterium]
MIDFISGIIIEKNPARIVLENGGLGYEVFISTNTFQQLPETGEKTRLKTYLHLREDSVKLFAFSREEERQVFLGLISVSGVGPRLAQTILSGLSLVELVRAIQAGDVTKLTSISGVGSKTAQRLIVELKDKFSRLGIVDDLDTVSSGFAALNSSEEETLLALLSLGYKRPAIEKAIAKIRKSGAAETPEVLIKKALQVI